MKRTFAIIACLVLLFFSVAEATLIDRGGGLIYDDVLDITWLQDANYTATSGYSIGGGLMNFSEATTWVTNLSYYDSLRGVYWDGWRLPRVLPVDDSSYDYSTSYDGATDIGYNISAMGSAYPGSTGSEMAYMYYINLVNTSYYPIDYPTSSAPRPGWSNTPNSSFIDGNGNEVSFTNLIANWYWAETPAYNAFDVFTFRFDYGGQNHAPKHPYYFAWAVRDGDVGPVPIPGPSTMLLIGTGLLGLIGFGRLRK